MFFGEWQGLTKKEASARDPARYSQWREDPTIGAPAGESPFEVSARAFAALEDLRARYDAGTCCWCRTRRCCGCWSASS